MASDIARVRELVAGEGGLAVVATLRSDGSVQASVVNAGVVAHPLTDEQVVAFVAMGGSLKLGHLRRRPRATVVFRVGFRWVSVEGQVTLIGPDDAVDGFDSTRLPQLLRDVFLSTGATHDDWPTYDRVMAEERRCVVLVRPERIYGP
ncbi:MAG TPA: TIGR03618 family F420-dependent PPOX class oxidoreductase [Candidatus Dormibacteraeota bacterium]